MAFEPRLDREIGADNYTSGDSITGTRDKTADENTSKAVVSYSSLAAASAVEGTAGTIFYAEVEGAFYGVVKAGDPTAQSFIRAISREGTGGDSWGGFDVENPTTTEQCCIISEGTGGDGGR